MKKIIGTIYRKEGKEGNRLYTTIECQECGARTYERKQNKIDAALNRGCMSCNGKAYKDKKLSEKISKQQDAALINAHRTAMKLHRRLIPDNRVKHGLCRGETARTYNIWKGMMDRCYNSNNKNFHHYGGRGIVVCDRWHDVANFIDDMKLSPVGNSIERLDVNGNYEPVNCVWIPKELQSSNRRNCLVNRGITDSVAHWRDYRRNRDRQLKGQPLSMPKGNCYTYKSPANAWWRAANRPDIRERLYGPLPKSHCNLRKK